MIAVCSYWMVCASVPLACVCFCRQLQDMAMFGESAGSLGLFYGVGNGVNYATSEGGGPLSPSPFALVTSAAQGAALPTDEATVTNNSGVDNAGVDVNTVNASTMSNIALPPPAPIRDDLSPPSNVEIINGISDSNNVSPLSNVEIVNGTNDNNNVRMKQLAVSVDDDRLGPAGITVADNSDKAQPSETEAVVDGGKGEKAKEKVERDLASSGGEVNSGVVTGGTTGDATVRLAGAGESGYGAVEANIADLGNASPDVA